MDIEAIYAENLKATYRGIEYTWEGGFGSVISSRERGLTPGQPRILGGIIFEVYRIDKSWFKKPKVHWTIIGNNDIEAIRQFKAKLFGCDYFKDKSLIQWNPSICCSG